MKLIKVDCCGNCPFRSYNDYDYCRYSLEGTKLINLSIVHPDCPLEDDIVFGSLTGEDLEFLAEMSKRETSSNFFEKEKENNG